MTAALYLGVDPGPLGVRHGWCLLRATAGGRPTWEDGGSSDTESLAAMVRLECLRAVGIETPSGYLYAHVRGAALVATAVAAGYLQGVAASRPIPLPILTPAAPEWRRALLGSKTATDDAIKKFVYRVIGDVPQRTNVHARDAACVALYALGHRAARPAPATATDNCRWRLACRVGC